MYKHHVLTAYGGGQLDILGLLIEAGGSIEVLSIEGNLGVGIKNGEFYFTNGASVVFDIHFILE